MNTGVATVCASPSPRPAEPCPPGSPRDSHADSSPQTTHGGRPSQLEPQTPTQHHETAGPRPASLSFIWGYWGPNCRAPRGVAHHSSLTGWERQCDGF